MKKDELLALGMTEDQADKVLAMNGRDIEKHKKTAEDAKTQVDTLTGQLADRDKDLVELKKSTADSDAIKTQLADLQAKYDKETADYKNQLAERDYRDAVSRMIADKAVKFSSKAAERAFLADLNKNRLECKDGQLVGFDEHLKAQREADPDAFAPDKPGPAFSRHVGGGGGGGKHLTAGEQLAKSIGGAKAKSAEATKSIISQYTGGGNS